MTKIISAFVALVVVSTGFAGERIEKRTEYTGNYEILALSNCSKPEVYINSIGEERVRSTFNLTTCKEKTSYRVKVTYSDSLFNWSSASTIIPGSEKTSYEYDTKEEGEDQLFVDQEQKREVRKSCRKLRRKLEKEVVSSQSMCGA